MLALIHGDVLLQVMTLVDWIQQLTNVKLTSAVRDAFSHWEDATRRVDSCRRDEITNAINRHRTKNISQTEKDRGISSVAFLVIYTENRLAK